MWSTMQIPVNGKMENTDIDRKEKVIALVLMISAFSESFFFSVNSLLGRKYGGSTTSYEYKLYLIVLLMINVIMRAKVYGKNSKVRPAEICALSVPAIYVVLTVFTCIRHGFIAAEIPSEIMYLVTWQYMAILSVLNLQSYCSMESILYALDWFILIVFFGGCRAAILSMGQVSNSLDTFGGATYQAASYFMAFAFGINTFLLLIKRRICVLQKMELYISNVLRLAISAILVCLVLFSGGRAGIVLVFAYLLVLTWWTWSDKRFSLNLWCLGVILCIVLLGVVLTILIDNPIFSLRFNRVFEYVTSGGIDFTKTSGRDQIYKLYWNYIKEKPILGYGILAHNYLGDYAPHNVILQILVEGGCVYFVLVLVYVVWLYRRWVYKKSLSKYFVVIMAVYPFVRIMFSANYVTDEIFWFAIMWGALSNTKWRE